MTLRYKDEDGDLCSLSVHTLEDFAAMFGDGIWRLYAELPQGIVAADCAASTSGEPEAAAEPSPSRQPESAEEAPWAALKGKGNGLLGDLLGKGIGKGAGLLESLGQGSGQGQAQGLFANLLGQGLGLGKGLLGKGLGNGLGEGGLGSVS